MNHKLTPILFTISLLFFSGLLRAQNSDAVPSETNASKNYSIKDYPDGFYYTLDDFINKVNRPYPLLQKRTLFGERKLPYDSGESLIFFYTAKDTSKLKNVFAVSFRGNLYIQQKYIDKYTRKGDRNEGGENPNLYHRVLKDGKFFYLEGLFGNDWAKAFAYGSGGAIGGVIGASINKLKGVVFDVDKKEFDFIKNCEDFNLFLSERNAAEKADCKQYSIITVREIMDTVIK